MEKPQKIKYSQDKNPLKIGSSTQYSEKDELLVWERFTQGDDQSLVYIYRKYVDVLYRYGRQFTARPEFLRDCIQELFYDLIDKRKGLSQAQSIKGYLFISLKRKIIRDLKKEEKMVLDEEGFNFSLQSDTVSISSGLDEKDLSVIQRKLNNLPKNQREVILLHFYEGLSYSEIADIMNIKVRSARVLTYRALDSLQKELGPHRDSLFISILLSGQII